MLRGLVPDLVVTAPGRSESRVAASASASAARSASSKSGFSYHAATVSSFSWLTPAFVPLWTPVSFVLHDVFEIPFGPEGTAVIRGAREVATQAPMGARRDAVVHPVLVDGVPGGLVTVGGRPFTVVAFTVADGAITAIRALTDPDRLAQIVPSWVA
jgi:hypothetical protein